MPAHLRTYIPKYLHTALPAQLHTYIATYQHTCIPTDLHTYITTYIPTYLHTYIRPYPPAQLLKALQLALTICANRSMPPHHVAQCLCICAKTICRNISHQRRACVDRAVNKTKVSLNAQNGSCDEICMQKKFPP